MPQSQSVAPSDPKATMAHSEVIHTPQVPVRSGSSLSTSAEISNSVVKVNPQVSLKAYSHQSEQQVLQNTTQFRYQTDQGYHYLQERSQPHNREIGHLSAQNMPMQGAPTHIRYAHSDAHTLPPTHRMASSTVSFMTRPNETLNVMQPRLNSFTQPQTQSVQHIGHNVPVSYTHLTLPTIYSV